MMVVGKKSQKDLVEYVCGGQGGGRARIHRCRGVLETIPLLLVQACVIISIPVIGCYKMFFTAIDVQFGGRQRYEIPSDPWFIDLRKPRVLKLVKLQEWKPAIHLDNRYRLMRNEPMLDADGKVTDDIGVDETVQLDMEEVFEKALKDGHPSRYFLKK